MSAKVELHPRPNWTAVVLEEVKAVGLGLRREFVAIVVFLVGFGAFFIALTSQPGFSDEHNFQPDILLPAILLSLVAPLAVWKSESPRRRTYLWSLPLSRRTGHLAKLASGWIWLMAALALYMLWSWGMALATDGLVWERAMTIYQPIDAGSAPLRAGEGQRFVYPMARWLLVVPFGAATLMYLLGSILVLSSNHPLRWAAGIWIAVLAVGGMAELSEDSQIYRTRDATESGQIVNPVVNQEPGILQRLLESDSPYGMENLVMPEVRRPERIPGTDLTLDVSRGNFSHWLTSITLWGGLVLLGAYVAAGRHRDP